MNIIDAFFTKHTWKEALEIVAARHTELQSDEARAAMNRRVTTFQGANAAYEVLRYYNDILGELSRGRVPLACLDIPKVTDEQLAELSCLRDATAAHCFVQRWPEIAEFIVIEQVVFGPEFWRLLFSWATFEVKAQPSVKPNAVIVMNNAQIPRKICKIIPLRDGGFFVTAPYHNARSGSLFKAPRVRQQGTSYIPISEVVPFTASDRVKLSYHADGFVQFSGEDNRKIRSGIVDGVPKGLGLKTNPLDRPVQSGPSVGCIVWGHEEFVPWQQRSDETAVLFGDNDFYTEPRKDDGRDCSAFSLFVFPSDQLEDAVGPVGTGDELSMRLPMNIYHRQSIFRVKLVRVSAATILGVIALREKCESEAPSGFQFASPSDGKHCLSATYPPIPYFENAESLDYKALSL